MTEAMADYVFGKEPDRKEKGPKPDALRQAHNIQRWGDPYGKGWMHWPFGMLEKCNTALNLYDIMRSWQATPDDKWGDWMTANPTAWEKIISPLLERQLEDGESQSWL